jgi:acetyl-CoA decarbonylase/synthase complex subunit gamma
MALSGLDIYKLLPRTNCKKCGFQTCLAFAMQLAKKSVALDKCPFVTPDVRATLEEAAQPAIRLVELGVGDRKVSIGHETVLFRHEEKFYHPTAIGFILDDTQTDVDMAKAVEEINALHFERVGQVLDTQLIALKNASNKKDRYLACLTKVMSLTDRPLVLVTRSADVLKESLKICRLQKPLAYCEDPGLLDAFAVICKEQGVALAFRATDIDGFSSAAKKMASMGLGDLVLDIAPSMVSERLWQLTQIRRLAIKKNERSLGFPTMVNAEGIDPEHEVWEAGVAIAKYASIVLLRTRRPEHVMPLLTLRQNIFTDPQKPLQVEPKVYAIGAAREDSPVLVTTNFSLTYYTVLGEIESSRVPSHLICVDTEGMSVLTAWAAEKFNAERVADTLVKFKLEEIVRHKDLIIPGYVSMMSGDLEEKSGWRILVGPREASGLPTYLKNLKG